MKAEQHLEQESMARRVLEFLKLHPPFRSMQEESVYRLADSSTIRYLDKGQYLFQSSEPLHDRIYMVRKGVVHIRAQEQLLDKCSEGEVLGSRALAREGNYMASAMADPEALVIGLSVEVLQSLMAQDASLMSYFFGDLRSGPEIRRRQKSSDDKGGRDLRLGYSDEPIGRFRTPVTCTGDTLIQSAARTMNREKVGSIVIVNEDFQPIGIVTDTDLRNRVATGEIGIDRPVSDIMSSPVKTVRSGLLNEDYLIEMLSKGAHHLCVTESGTDQEALLGVVTDHDLLLSRGNNAAVLFKELRRSKNTDERIPIVARFDAHIQHLVEHDFPIQRVARIMQAFNRQLLSLCIHEAVAAMGLEIDPQSFCWLALGSTARGEQVIRTDFDAGLVYADEQEGGKERFITLAQQVYQRLEKLGYAIDKAGIQADNPQWTMSLSEWKEQFKHWIAVPEEEALLHATIFFDLMPFFGNESLAISLQEFIQASYKGNKRYGAFLATNALQNPPPLGFFKTFLLEKSGEHKDTFDIKARAMMPLADAARLQALEHGCLYPASTIERYERLAERDPIHAERYTDAALAYSLFMRLRAEQGLVYDHDGRFIDISALPPLEKQVLKKAFEPIGAMQHLIKPA